ncbi:MAG: hypothetical protein M3177_05515 [Pseudomonadota bacterium]|nr:hypothetical protein [Pseudomonadota bacterium]
MDKLQFCRERRGKRQALLDMTGGLKGGYATFRTPASSQEIARGRRAIAAMDGAVPFNSRIWCALRDA